MFELSVETQARLLAVREGGLLQPRMGRCGQGRHPRVTSFPLPDDLPPVPVFDRSLPVKQVHVLETLDLLVLRADKGGIPFRVGALRDQKGPTLCSRCAGGLRGQLLLLGHPHTQPGAAGRCICNCREPESNIGCFLHPSPSQVPSGLLMHPT